MKRRTLDDVLATGSRITERERDLIRLIDRLRLMSHKQGAALLDDGRDVAPVSAARIARRRLARLVELGILARLERRVGGVRAGSQGYVYYLGPTGQRLVAFWQGQGLARGRYRPEPGERYVAHRLAVSQVYVDLIKAEQRGLLDLLDFDAEPDCWRALPDAFGGRTLLKPDAFVRLGIGAYEDRYFAEVDLGSESRTVVLRKLKLYAAYWRTGREQAEHEVFPHVVWLVSSETRKAALVSLAERLPADVWRLFIITTVDRALEVFVGGNQEAAEDAALGGPA